MRLLFAVFLMLPVASSAQEPPALDPAAAVGAPASDGVVAVGDTVFAKAETPSVRFPDADEEGPKLAKDSRLVVLVVEGDRLRVMDAKDQTFGWIPSSAVTAAAPAPDLDAILKQLGDRGVPGAQ